MIERGYILVLVELFVLARCDGAGKPGEELKSFPVQTPPGKHGQQQSRRVCTRAETGASGSSFKDCTVVTPFQIVSAQLG